MIANLYKHNLLNFPYVNADIFEKQYFSNITNDVERSQKAMFFTTKLVNELLQNGKSFCYESVFSHPSKVDLVKTAIESGYKIKVIYMYTENYFINISRVQKRISEGGHFVPEEKIINRFTNSAIQIEKLKTLCNDFEIFNNSQNRQ